MKLARLRLSNFRSFGTVPTEIDFTDTTFLLGPNGSGKTCVLQALARLFSFDPAQRRFVRSDFHVPHDEEDHQAHLPRQLWIEADFEFPELAREDAEAEGLPSVPANFAHLQLVDEGAPARVRFRLQASIDQDDDVEETMTYVVKVDADDAPLEESRVSKQDRNAIHVHYLPARRDPSDHISYSARALLGRVMRSVDWSSQRAEITKLTSDINTSLEGNAALSSIAEVLGERWSDLHTGDYYADPAISFARSEIENVLRHMSICFTPGHGESLVDFSRLSDGQQSLLYVSLVLAIYGIGQKVLNGELADLFDAEKLRPATFTLIAVEEPENSLSPHYLGRVVKALGAFASGAEAQALLATHSPSLLKRVPPESVRYLRLGEARETVIKHIVLPQNEDAQKYVREAVQAFPELYFSRLVILGEGDSEEIVLPRLLAARGILADDASISVVPLGGRHVNHFWRLLNELAIPHVTLLDLDLARYQGGWGRVKYAANQLRRFADVRDPGFSAADVNGIPAWNAEHGFILDDGGWTARLESNAVFFSSPLDLDFMMIEAYPHGYEIEDNDKGQPDDETLKAVLGKSRDTIEGQYSEAQLACFGFYHGEFKLSSKPTTHLKAMARLSDDDLLAALPDVLGRLFDRIDSELAGIPE